MFCNHRYYVFIISAYFDIVPLEMHWDKWSWFYNIDRCHTMIMTVDKHELLFRILNRGLFSLLTNCVHKLAVKTQPLREFFIRDMETYSNMFPSSRTLVYMLNSLFNDLTRITFKQRITVPILASHMIKSRWIREEI